MAVMGVIVVAGASAGRAQVRWIIGERERPPQIIYREDVGKLFEKGMMGFPWMRTSAIQQYIAVLLEAVVHLRDAIRLPEIHASGVAVDVDAVPVGDAPAACPYRFESR